MNRAAILVIDDDKNIRLFLSEVLKQEGYEVLTATDGLEGLHMAQTKRPDLIILDFMMPGLNGLEVSQRLKQDVKTNAIPILAASAMENTSQVAVSAALAAGCDDFLAKETTKILKKPFDIDALLATIKKMLEKTAPSTKTSKPEASQKEEGLPGIIEHGPFRLDTAARMVLVSGKRRVSLAGKPVLYKILVVFLLDPGAFGSPAELLEAIADDDHQSPGSRSIEKNVERLQEELGPEGRQWIVRIRGKGYCLLKNSPSP